MTRKRFVAGNWKMHGNRHSIAELLAGLVDGVEGSAEMAVFPPSLYLQVVAEQLSGTAIAYGAQNVSEYGQGAYTGELAAEMLVDLGCRYTLVGHSERRALFAESSAQVADKFAAAIDQGVTPILCVGETLQQREQEQTLAVIAEQLDAVISRVGLANVAQGMVAYEPVWAIGTGVTASPEQAQDVHKSIRERLGDVGETTTILYGGSVKAANAQALFSQPDIDGGLVGGASLDAAEFIQIYNAANAA